MGYEGLNELVQLFGNGFVPILMLAYYMYRQEKILDRIVTLLSRVEKALGVPLEEVVD